MAVTIEGSIPWMAPEAWRVPGVERRRYWRIRASDERVGAQEHKRFW